MTHYEPKSIEPKWQHFWEKHQLFQAVTGDKKPKYYILDMFPYPSSTGLHVGHPEGYTASDIIARYHRARGFNVLHPMGWDAFGLPAEQHAIQTGVHPAITTQRAIDHFRSQLKRLGFSYDWSREISTADPHYYRWTQFLFLKLYEKGLAYQKEVPVNWCPALKTVLANEEVINGLSERGKHPVFRVPMKQWMLKITDYAERLLKDLESLDWPESTKELQRHWIGRSAGLMISFQLQNSTQRVEVFTTCPETIFGVTYLVLAPEHLLIQEAPSALKEAILNYQQLASQKSEITRQEDKKDKTGLATGLYAIHPILGTPLPIWTSDYVLMNYGTGAVMGVPAHDTRDLEFATKMQLPIQTVIDSVTQRMIHSDFLNGMTPEEAKKQIIKEAEKQGWGHSKIQYRLRDWLFSRQRYWGEPFPIVHLQNGDKKPLEAHELPVLLPNVESYEPSGTGESPLSSIVDWVYTLDATTGQKVRRETDTMPGSAGSSWYFLRYCDPKNSTEPFSATAENYWMPVDFYLGGPEHAVGHLLYARFWTKVLYDAGLVSCDEPFRRLVHQGMILGEDGEKMSKSRGNIINPDEIIEQYGADALRVYEMFMGPLERDKPWSTTAIQGVSRFLQRIWRLMVPSQWNSADPSIQDLKLLHKTIKKVTEDIIGLRFNTAISQLMIFVNHFTAYQQQSKQCMRPFIQLLQPFAPHLAEELWDRLGETCLLSFEPWPSFDPQLAEEDQVSIAVQVLGKTRGTITTPLHSHQETVECLAKKLTTVDRQLMNRKILKIIFVKNKIINFIIE